MKQPRLKLAINIAVIICSLLVISQKSAVHYKTSMFENLMIDSFAPMQRSIFYFKGKINSFFRHYALNINASKKNLLLGNKIKKLENKIFKYEELARENNRLKELLKFGEEIKRDRVLAQIVSWDASSDFIVLRVNKGSKDGINLFSPVVTAKGLVGHVTRITKHFSEVYSILNPGNKVDAIVQRTRSHGIVNGSPRTKGKCIMRYVTRTEPVILNDLVLTSGLGNIYPKGLKIGTISKID